MDLFMFTWLFGFVWLCWTVVYAFINCKKASVSYAALLVFQCALLWHYVNVLG